MSVYKRNKGDMLWENARIVAADIPLNRQNASRILPFGMRLTDDEKATIFIADYTKTSFTSPYRETALLMHVKTPLGKGIHCPWMLVDDDTALIYGRELLGYPKKMAQFSFIEKKDCMQASVKRRNHVILSLKAEIGLPQESPNPFFSIKTFNPGGPGQFLFFNFIWMVKSKEIIRQSYDARVSISVNHSIFDPISEIISGKPFNGRFIVMDIPPGGYILPVGITGPRWAGKVHTIRFE